VRRRPLHAAVSLTVLALALTACSGDVSAPATTQPATVTAAPAEPTDAAPGEPSTEPSANPSDAPEAAPSAVPSAAPSAEPSPTAAPSPAAPSFDVAAAQRTLADLGYYLGAVDGERGGAFRSAVMAFQKVQGLGADGVVGPATLQALAAPVQPVLKASSPANRVEVDLSKQVLYVVKGGAISRILPVSSGNGATYEQKDGSTARALTPTGRYTIQRRIVGERKADLGTLYDPQYFYRGWAIHGSNSVPAGPASHGCVRVTRADAKWLLGAIGNGTSVYLYGGKHVFSAGSAAAGTDSPTGDTGGAAAPAPVPVATSAAPKPVATPAPKPVATTPAPKPAPSSAAPSAPAPSATASTPPAAPSAAATVPAAAPAAAPVTVTPSPTPSPVVP